MRARTRIRTEVIWRTDIRVIDLGQESHLWRCHGILFWQEEFCTEYSIYNGVRSV